MATDTSFYFSHDYNSRNDAKIKRLLSKHGMIGYGCFWAIVEDLYNNANALPTDYESIAFDLRIDIKIVESIIKDFELFVVENNVFGSLSIQKRIDERNSKSIKARDSANKRWSNANALPTESKGNAIKERKGKEIKEIKEIKERKKTKENEDTFFSKNDSEKKQELVYPFDSPAFAKAWSDWRTYKKETHKFAYQNITTEQAALISLSKLTNGNESLAIDSIIYSIGRKWEGIYLEKKNEKNGSGQAGKSAAETVAEANASYFANLRSD